MVNDRAKINERSRIWRLQNKDRVKAYRKKYDEENARKLKAYRQRPDVKKRKRSI
jgi:hypothetical protein